MRQVCINVLQIYKGNYEKLHANVVSGCGEILLKKEKLLKPS
jgi:hypothetical protein